MSLLSFVPSEDALRRMYADMYHDFEHTAAPYWKNLSVADDNNFEGAFGEIENTHDEFAVAVDVCAFQPKEISVNVTGHEVTIIGHHDVHQDGHGCISRSFVRKYTFPQDVNLEKIHSHLSKEGKLTVEVPKATL